MRTRRRKPLAERFWAKVDKTDGCWLWTGGRSKSGYGVISAGGKDEPDLGAHRVSWEMHLGPIPPGQFVCHHCDVRHCVRPDHLFLGTGYDNAIDRGAKGRAAVGDANGARRHPERLARGERNVNAKLTEADVRRLRERHGAGVPCYVIAAEEGLDKSTVQRLVRRETWKHVL